MLTKEQKTKIVEDLGEKIARIKAMVLIDYAGMNVGQISELRKKLKEIGAELQVAKKRLVDIALKNNKLDLNLDKTKGQIAVAFGYLDEVSVAKVAHSLSGNNKLFKLLSGIVSGKSLDAEEVRSLAKLPSREELIAKVVGTIAAPISGFANVLQGNTRGLVRVLSQIKK